VKKPPKSLRMTERYVPGGDPIEILLVEDTEFDARRTMDALRKGKVRNTVSWVKDGEEAVDFLRHQGRHAAAPRPDLVLLDWYLPKLDGWEVLEKIKDDDDLKRIPVVIMTTSEQESDVLKAYNLHANCYVTKPVDLGKFLEVVRSIEDFWLTVVKLPAA
jgi:CheY-like chemotaxis protein